jgi:O-antigen/teichoic acid export membrane protein
MDASEPPPHPRPGLTGVVVRGAASSSLGFAVRHALSLITALVLARLVTPAQFGAFVAGTVAIELGGSFAGSGMLAALIQRRDRLEESANTALLATLAAGLGLAALQLAASPLLGEFFHSARVRDVAAASAGLLLLGSAAVVPSALLQRRFQFTRRIVVEPVMALSYGIVSVAACAAGMGTWGLVLGAYAAAFTQAGLTWWYAHWRPRPRLASLSLWRELVRFARHILAYDVLERVNFLAPPALVGRVLNPAAVGSFGYASRIAALPRTAAIDVGSFVLLPAFARIAEDERRFRSAFLRSLRTVTAVSAPAGLILLPLGPGLVALLFGPRWHAAGPAIAAMCVYSAGLAPMDLATEAFKAHGSPAAIPRMLVVRTVVSVGGMAALSPLGLTGIAAGLSLGAFLTGAYAHVLLARRLDLPLRATLSAVWRSWTAAVVMAGAVLALDRLVLHAGTRGSSLATAARLALEAGMAGALYLATLALLGESGPLRALPRRRVRDASA